MGTDGEIWRLLSYRIFHLWISFQKSVRVSLKMLKMHCKTPHNHHHPSQLYNWKNQSAKRLTILHLYSQFTTVAQSRRILISPDFQSSILNTRTSATEVEWGVGGAFSYLRIWVKDSRPHTERADFISAILCIIHLLKARLCLGTSRAI